MRRQDTCEKRIHAGGVALDRNIKEILDLGKLDDLVKFY